MNESQRMALLILLDREMLSKGSWCGETHLQKATFLLQDLAGVDLGFDFVLYRHGPFSFDLRDQLSATLANGLLCLQVKQLGYGPAYVPTEFSETFLERFPKTTERHIEQVKFIAGELGDMNVGALEKLATAFFLTEHENDQGLKARAEKLVQTKPHISYQDAIKACEDADAMVERAMNFRMESGDPALLE